MISGVLVVFNYYCYRVKDIMIVVCKDRQLLKIVGLYEDDCSLVEIRQN